MKTDTDQRTSSQYPERSTLFDKDGLVRKSLVVGCGAYLPENIVTNDDLAQRIDTSDAWIRKRTGIQQRHIAADGELTSDLAVAACRPALESAGVDPQEIDLIVLATSTPDNTFPATATRVQAALGIKRAAAFDVQAVCSGFVHALSIADNMIRLGQANTALVIGAEVFSRILDWEDRGTCVLFGDGAGALVLQSGMSDTGPSGRGVLSTHLFADGTHYDSLYVDGGVGTTGQSGFLRMAGQEVYRHAVHNMAEAVEIALEANGLNLPDIDLLVPHQANIRIIESIGRRLALKSDKVVITVGSQANTSAATIPLALTNALENDRVKSGDLIALTALGGGFTWGSSLIRW